MIHGTAPALLKDGDDARPGVECPMYNELRRGVGNGEVRSMDPGSTTAAASAGH